jgi:DNA-binding NarL/FixJ family response regulator
MFVRASATRILAQGIGKKDPLATERARFERLTEREQNVLKFTARGYSAPEIGERLCISPKTVDTYKQRIGDKLGLTHRAEYISFALKLGLLSE